MHAFAIDIGATNIKLGLVDENGRLSSQVTCKTPGKPAEAVNLIYKYFSSLPIKVTIAGLGIPGPLDVARTTVYNLCNMPGWNQVPIKKLLEDKLKLSVIVENDANVAAWAEYKCGEAKGAATSVLYTLGTGVGGGIVVNGALITGRTGNAGELGHTKVYFNGRKCGCGGLGCLEAYSSCTAVEKIYFESAGRRLACKEIFDAFSSDEMAKEAVHSCCRALAISISNIIATVDPNVIVLAGGMSYNSKLIIKIIKNELKELVFFDIPKIVSSKLKDLAGVIGAGLWALKIYETSA